MRKYSTTLYLFLTGGILVGCSYYFKDLYPVLSKSFLIMGYGADLAALYFLIKTAAKK